MKSIFIAILSLSLLYSCTDKKKETTTNKPAQKKVIKTTKPVKEPVVIVDKNGVANINLTTSDAMKFNTKKIVVKAGQKIKLTLSHKGKLDKRVMGHNFVLLKKGTKLSSFASKAAAAKNNDYIPEDDSEVIAHTKMIGGQEKTTIEFEAPATGEYDFICSFPAHFAMMKGKFIVE
ncbi:azurin [uncultured Polaribacter sp.]|uniref:azurin n=1 Tax=uncultured Polaribacter sp. TaxID=174711 RepID=UPI0026024E57|nr:azurin [uncultured Polaribacter sp.]